MFSSLVAGLPRLTTMQGAPNLTSSCAKLTLALEKKNKTLSPHKKHGIYETNVFAIHQVHEYILSYTLPPPDMVKHTASVTEMILVLHCTMTTHLYAYRVLYIYIIYHYYILGNV